MAHCSSQQKRKQKEKGSLKTSTMKNRILLKRMLFYGEYVWEHKKYSMIYHFKFNSVLSRKLNKTREKISWKISPSLRKCIAAHTKQWQTKFKFTDLCRCWRSDLSIWLLSLLLLLLLVLLWNRWDNKECCQITNKESTTTPSQRRRVGWSGSTLSQITLNIVKTTTTTLFRCKRLHFLCSEKNENSVEFVWGKTTKNHQPFRFMLSVWFVTFSSAHCSFAIRYLF